MTTRVVVVARDERIHELIRAGVRDLGSQFAVHAVGVDDLKTAVIAFVDVEDSGIGLEAVTRMWDRHPGLEIVVCADGRFAELARRLDHVSGDRVVFLRKPFEPIEARQLVASLGEKSRRAQCRSQRLESLGRVAAGLAHEINTPAHYVGASLEFVAELLPRLQQAIAPGADPELDALLAELPIAIADARVGIEQITRLVKAVRSQAHLRDREGLVAVDVNAQVHAALELASFEYKLVADRVVQLGEVPAVLGDPGDLMLAIMNLVINAAHAIRERGERGVITVSTVARADVVEIAIADTGGGIPPEVREHIFEPFFTTKPVGQGTGQGLAIARTTIVERHRGTLSFETELGRGTVFTIRLPRLAAEGAR